MRNRKLVAAVALLILLAFVVARTTAGPDSSGARRDGRAPKTPRSNEGARSASQVCAPRSRVLTGVYHPERLRVIDSCRRVRGRVVAIKGEEDGDLHVRVRLERSERRLLMAANFSEQRGSLVVEFMPRDRGHLPAPRPGDRLSLVGAYVEDLDHSWTELHPVWQVSINGRRPRRSGPQFGGSPPSARSESAAVSCRTAAEERCSGYRGPPFYLGARGGGPGPPSDRDCSDFGTQAEAQRYFVSKGGPARDPDRLDADHDGRACELLPR